jgi:hypothetical protein
MHGFLWPRGDGTNRRRNGSWALVCAAALGVMVLAACGSVHATVSPAASGHTSSVPPVSSAPPGAGSSQSAPLCREAATVTRLEVVRNHGYKVPELEPAFPTMVTVTNPALLRDVIRALCALPVLPPGVYHCPAMLLGTAYTLRFSVGSRPLPLVTIDETGCETVTGVGPVRRVTSEGFWQVLSKAIGSGTRSGPGCRPPSTRTTKTYACPEVARPGAGVVAPAAAAAS